MPKLGNKSVHTLWNSENLTAYNFNHSDENERPEGLGKLLKGMVGASGFEPPTSWSRTRCQGLLNSVKSCCS